MSGKPSTWQRGGTSSGGGGGNSHWSHHQHSQHHDRQQQQQQQYSSSMSSLRPPLSSSSTVATAAAPHTTGGGAGEGHGGSPLIYGSSAAATPNTAATSSLSSAPGGNPGGNSGGNGPSTRRNTSGSGKNTNNNTNSSSTAVRGAANSYSVYPRQSQQQRSNQSGGGGSGSRRTGSHQHQHQHQQHPLPASQHGSVAVGSVVNKSSTPPQQKQPHFYIVKEHEGPPPRADHMRPALALSALVMQVYQGINNKFYEEQRRWGVIGGQRTYNDGYDDAEGHYIHMVGEKILDRYTVQSVLGKGSFGTVLQCCDEKHHEEVAVKIIRSGAYFEAQGQLEMEIVLYLNEQEELRNLVMHLLKAFYWQGHIVLVFELLSYNLYELIKCTHFNGVSLDLTRKFAIQLLEVLHQLDSHRPRIIHSDLKPENVVLKDRKRSGIRVIDFGSACYQQVEDWRVPPPLVPLGSTLPSVNHAEGSEGGEDLNEVTQTGACATLQHSNSSNSNKHNYRRQDEVAASSSSHDAQPQQQPQSFLQHPSYNLMPKYVQSRFYRSPEVILELGYTTAIDRWSLGCMVVELHTGVPLFPGLNEVEMIAYFTAILGPLPDEMIAASPKFHQFYIDTRVEGGKGLSRHNTSTTGIHRPGSGGLFNEDEWEEMPLQLKDDNAPAVASAAASAGQDESVGGGGVLVEHVMDTNQAEKDKAQEAAEETSAARKVVNVSDVNVSTASSAAATVTPSQVWDRAATASDSSHPPPHHRDPQDGVSSSNSLPHGSPGQMDDAKARRGVPPSSSSQPPSQPPQQSTTETHSESTIQRRRENSRTRAATAVTVSFTGKAAAATASAPAPAPAPATATATATATAAAAAATVLREIAYSTDSGHAQRHPAYPHQHHGNSHNNTIGGGGESTQTQQAAHPPPPPPIPLASVSDHTSSGSPLESELGELHHNNTNASRSGYGGSSSSSPFVLRHPPKSEWVHSLSEIVGVHTGGPRGCRAAQVGHDVDAYLTFVSFVQRLLAYNPCQRISCVDALDHPFLAPLRDTERRAAVAAAAAPPPQQQQQQQQ